jgi:hypothetical protein
MKILTKIAIIMLRVLKKKMRIFEEFKTANDILGGNPI